MTWESFYLICFLVGLLLSALSLLGGMGHFGAHVHLPHVSHGGHIPHLPPARAGIRAAQTGAAGSATVPWWNAFSLTVFLCWFGAAGFLLTRHGSFVAAMVLVMASACGLAGGAIVFLLLTRVLLPRERELTADETAVVGAVGHITAAIRNGGTGEMVYEQTGALRSVPARSADGEPIQKQEEVFVVRYEKGIAYVRKWDEALRNEN